MNIGFADTYDRLFPFIHGNAELAAAVGRYIAWVKTPADVVKLLDTNLIQYLVKNIFARRYEYGNDNVDLLFKLVVIQGDARISEPWLERMYTQGVVFQLTGTQPIPHALSTATKRDGTTEIGSQYYTADGGPALDAARYMDLYLRQGGLAQYDLARRAPFSRVHRRLLFGPWKARRPGCGAWGSATWWTFVPTAVRHPAMECRGGLALDPGSALRVVAGEAQGPAV